jgi:hypothetical protein
VGVVGRELKLTGGDDNQKRRNSIRSVSLGPLNFQMQEAAVKAAAIAARDWQAKTPNQTVDVSRIRATVGPALAPAVADNLTGKSILWGAAGRPAGGGKLTTNSWCVHLGGFVWMLSRR